MGNDVLPGGGRGVAVAAAYANSSAFREVVANASQWRIFCNQYGAVRALSGSAQGRVPSTQHSFTAGLPWTLRRAGIEPAAMRSATYQLLCVQTPGLNLPARSSGRTDAEEIRKIVMDDVALNRLHIVARPLSTDQQAARYRGRSL